MRQGHRAWQARWLLGSLLGLFAAVALFGSAHGAAQPPDLTGTWTDSGGGKWQLKASGAGLGSLHATWGGAPGSHTGLRGRFDGTLNQRGTAYTGPLHIDEGSLHVTGTMTFAIVSDAKLVITYTQSNGPHGTIVLKRKACAGCLEGPVKIQIDFHAARLLTAPPSDGGRCPPTVTAKVTGSIEAQITPNGDTQGGGNVTDTPLLARCRAPGIKFVVDQITVEAPTPGKIVRATMAVHIDGEATHQPGQCLVGTKGTIVATYDDTSTAANSLPAHRLHIGPWQSPCNADNHVITNNISSITAGSAGSTYVHVFIGCLGPGYSPRNCGT